MMKILLVIVSVFSFSVSHAGLLNIKVSDKDNQQFANAVVYLESDSANESYTGNEIATMDQINRQFSPYILAIQKGQTVSFPNSDSIKHHVYSFSPARVFELQLFKNRSSQSVTFNKAGIIELGCNIHDWMLGYIFVASNPYFGQTNTQGELTIEAPDGEYFLRVWHPRMQAEDIGKKHSVKIAHKQALNIQLNEALAPDNKGLETDIDEFSDYE